MSYEGVHYHEGEERLLSTSISPGFFRTLQPQKSNDCSLLHFRSHYVYGVHLISHTTPSTGQHQHLLTGFIFPEREYGKLTSGNTVSLLLVLESHSYNYYYLINKEHYNSVITVS